MELNFCIWRNSVLKLSCTSYTWVVVKKKYYSHWNCKTGLSGAIALETELKTGPSLSYILADMKA
jgi:hypothetical protein